MGRLAAELADGVNVGQVAGEWAVAEMPTFGTPVPDPAIDPHSAHWHVCHAVKLWACGFWQLLHILAAALVKDSDAQAVDARDCIYEFVRDFFPCPSCRSHFLEQYEACEHGVCDVGAGGAAALQAWLWRLHNAVTARVHTSAGSAPRCKVAIKIPPKLVSLRYLFLIIS